MAVPRSSLQATGLLRHATPEACARLAQGARETRHAEGETLWRAGDPAAELTFIRRGLVQIIKPAAAGPAAALGLFGPHECVGLVAVMGPHRYPADAVAISERVELLHVPASEFGAVMQQEPALAEAAHRALVQASQMLLAKIDVLTAGEVPQRLATLFLHLADRFGDVFAQGELRIPVGLSRAVLARLVGARSETVTRVMTRWERDGLLRTESDGFAVRDRACLVEQAGATS
ncbi:MAG: Crp/Fnr family transcriptional regulator [Myxococcales bacterium]|jgi:CRP-like cAMP-binding protein|nr:Crp/Fnr family transcriptional regulator [Myxococcales bacterium]